MSLLADEDNSMDGMSVRYGPIADCALWKVFEANIPECQLLPH